MTERDDEQIARGLDESQEFKRAVELLERWDAKPSNIEDLSVGEVKKLGASLEVASLLIRYAAGMEIDYDDMEWIANQLRKYEE